MNRPTVLRIEDYMPKRGPSYIWAHLLIITSVIFAIYFNSLNNGFVGDDIAFVQKNVSIRDLGNTPAFFYSPKTLAANDSEWGTIIYRPLRTLSYAMDYSIFGLNPWGFHLTSTVLHLAACVTLYFLILSLFNIEAVAFLGAIVFAVHPVHVEAVSWISSRADIIGLIFLNLSLLSYIRYRRNSSVPYLILALIFSLISYLGKETMISLPGIIILYDYASGDKKPLKELVKSNISSWMLFSVICLGYLVFRFSMTGRMSTSQGWWGGSAYANFLMMAKATAIYIRLIALPVNLTLHYLIDPVRTVFDLKVIASVLTIFSTLAAIVYFHKKNRMVFFTLVWFYLALIPIANIIPISFSMMAERYIYMPSAGPIIAIGYGFYLFFKKAGERGAAGRNLAAGAIALVLTAFSIIVVYRNTIYKDDFAFYTEAVRTSQNSAPSYNGLADQYYSKKDYGRAIENYEMAIAIDPNYADAFMGEAIVYGAQKNHIKAIQLGERAIALKPNSALLRFAMGDIYREANFLEMAVSEWEKAVKLNPEYSEAYNNLGIYYQMANNYPRAIYMFEQSIRTNPLNAETYYNAAVLYEAQGDQGKARDYYSRFLRLAGPEYKDTVEGLKRKGIN